MIKGIGVDVIAVSRIERIWRRYGDRFATHVLSPEERQQFSYVVDPARWLAKRWASKEAFAKAAGTGMRAPLKWSSITLTHDKLGRPGLSFAPFINAWLARHVVGRCHLSISDERDLVCAFVILETEDPIHVAA